jgi:hypothetical protein
VKNKLLQIIEGNWDKIDGGKKPGRIQFILLNEVFLVFRDDDKNPFIILKYSRENSLEQEFKNLKTISKVLPDLTPEPYFYKRVGKYFLFGESFKPGTKASSMVLTKDLIQAIFDTILKFHEAFYNTKFHFDKKHLDEMVVRPINHFAKITSNNRIEIELGQLSDKLQQMRNYNLPYIPQHSDFCLGNVIFDNLPQKVYIVDWADFGKTYLPLYDVFLLILNCYFAPEKFRGLLEDNPINNSFVEFLNAYLKHFEIDTKWVQILFPIALITFFNQNYPHRMQTYKTLEQLIAFNIENKDKLFFNKLL